jgi:hypothetical protein
MRALAYTEAGVGPLPEMLRDHSLFVSQYSIMSITNKYEAFRWLGIHERLSLRPFGL